MTLGEKAEAFRRAHAGPGLMILPNAWDGASARLFEQAGFAAVATTSAGIAWSLGYPDGGAPRDEMIAAAGVVVRSVRVPVTVDAEDGYGASPGDVAETVRRLLDVGAAGLNLEDAPGPDGGPLADADSHARRIAAARAAADAAEVAMVVNARTDVFWRAVGPQAGRLDEAVRRLSLYRRSGADCLFAPGVRDAATITALVDRLEAPLNVLVGPESPPLAELARLGVRRVSVGSGPARAVLARVRAIAGELRRDGSLDGLADALGYAQAQALWAGADPA